MITELVSTWDKIKEVSKQEIITPKTVLLEEGEIAKNIYYIEKGCLLLHFYNDGKDITFQFFFENSMVASFDSLYGGQPSQFFLKSLETTTIQAIKKEDFYNLINEASDGRKRYEDIQSGAFSTLTKEGKTEYKEALKTANGEAFKTGSGAVFGYTGSVIGGQANEEIKKNNSQDIILYPIDPNKKKENN